MSDAAATQTSAPATIGTTRTRTRGAVVLRTAQILLALLYGFSGFAKLIAQSDAVESFDRMGWAHWSMYVIGALEFSGAVALLFIPALASAAAVAYIGLMIGASAVQLTLLDPQNAFMPLVLIVPLVLIARARRHHAKPLVTLVRRRA
ncbi:DoxX family protein [Streptomyces sp. NPDC050738]|uniref:DoxX family protein n=1 Tax=Streptomyces sp. NPDC050738 TaxID=3154744 RepID=UPI0034386228